jgi:5-methylcytosine-specific restriction endonuclease McrA
MATHTTPEQFAEHLHGLRLRRRALKKSLTATRVPRQALSRNQREAVLAKTGGRCHICGGMFTEPWQADHVLAHSGGGGHIVDNYLPAHSICNNCRWDYTADELQEVLKLGVWIRKQIEDRTPLGLEAAARYLAHDTRRAVRRKRPIES